jgi:sulfur relay (sulfurtransferase) complex TusBCD TusD component (DsrE family)
MSVLLVVNTPPYGSEGPYNAFRLAEALVLRAEHVDVFLMGDAVQAARAGQDPRGAHASLEQMLVDLLERAVDVSCCGTCCATRGLTEHDLIKGVRIATIHDLAAATTRSDKVVSF